MSPRMVSTVDSINGLLRALPIRPKASRCQDLFVPREVVSQLKRRALKRSVSFLRGVVDDIKSAQERHECLDPNEVLGRKEFATSQIHHLKAQIERVSEDERIKKVKQLLGEVEYYERIGARPASKIFIGREMTLDIFRRLSSTEAKPVDPYIGEYLRRRISFSHEPPSDIEVSVLRAMVGVLRGHAQPENSYGSKGYEKQE